MPSITSRPSMARSRSLVSTPPAWRANARSRACTRQVVRTRRWSERFERMRRPSCPPESSSTRGPMVSAMVLTRFAPIASRQSTSTWTTRQRCPRSRTSMARGPPPRATRPGTARVPISSSSAEAASSRRMAAPGSGTSKTCTWLVISSSIISAQNPPPARTMRAALDAAAITLGSSTTIGTSRSWPLTCTFSAMPKGRLYTPSTFSTTLSAVSGSSPPRSTTSRMCWSFTPARSATRRRRSSSGSL